MSGLLSSLFGFATNSGIFPSVFNYVQSERQREWNEQQVQQANQWNIENWQRQNAYNDPAAQMQRLRNAGINPALAFASGQVDNTASTPSSAASAAPWTPYMADPLTLSSARLQDANAAKAEAEADLLRQQLPEQLNQLRLQNRNLEKQIDNWDYQWQSMSVDDQYKTIQSAKLIFDADMSKKQYRLARAELHSLIGQRRVQNRLTTAEAKQAELNVDFLLRTIAARALGVSLQNQKMLADIGLTNAQTKGAIRTASLLGMDLIGRYPHFRQDLWKARNYDNPLLKAGMAVDRFTSGFLQNTAGQVFGGLFR